MITGVVVNFREMEKMRKEAMMACRSFQTEVITRGLHFLREQSEADHRDQALAQQTQDFHTE